MSQTSQNYHADGGNEWIIGGKLTFLPGATVEGADGLLDMPGARDSAQLSNMKASEATTVAALREEYNRLLTALKACGLMAPDAQP